MEAARNQDLDAESPEFVMLDDRANALLERAQELGAAGREDSEAVAEIIHMTGRHRRPLQLAALAARQWGQHRDYSSANRAHRLLQAALTDGPVAPATPDDRRRFGILDGFTQLEPAEQWSELLRREPRLVAMQHDASAGRFGSIDEILELATFPSEQRMEAGRHLRRQLEELRQQLQPIVGPASGQGDVVLSSHLAGQIAYSHLIRRSRGAACD
jgi:hypothetical protein